MDALTPLLHGTHHSDGLTIHTWRTAPKDELLDGLLVTLLPTPDHSGWFTRVAVFDPAENTTLPDHRLRAHQAVHLAMLAFTTKADPTDAVTYATRLLYDESTPPMRGYLVTGVWADLAVTSYGTIQLLSAGRVGDGDILIASPTTYPHPILHKPMFEPNAGQGWKEWVNQHDPTINELWEARQKYISLRSQYANPPFGQFKDISPEMIRPDFFTEAITDVWIGTDGIELEKYAEQYPICETLPDWLHHLRTREPSVKHGPAPHGDIAAAHITL